MSSQARTKTHKRILEAVERGYSVSEDGVFSGPKGVLTIRLSGNQRYPTFSTNWGGVFGVPAHMFAAYIFYGDLSFSENLVVRHLDGDTENLSKSNIVLGTHSDNNLDKDPAVRISAAKKAREAQGVSSFSAKLSKEAVYEIREFYAKLDGKKAPQGSVRALCDKFGVTRTVIINVKNGVNYDWY
ncbi:hypothetical protein D3C86_1080740 [compost metagenome]